jgi:hypothetical protein
VKIREEIRSGLKEFRGSEKVHRLYGGVVCTDGVRWLMDAADCWWLISIICSYQNEEVIQHFGGYQFWNFTFQDNAGVVTARADSDKPILIS